MIDYRNAAYISACRAKYTAEQNQARHASLGADLVRYGIEALPVTGVYNGVPEQSYMVKAARFEDVINVRQLGRRYEQESVLFTRDSAASLWFTATDANLPLGHIREDDDSATLGDHTRLRDGRVLVVA
jgi:hypothetical protein